MSRKTSSKTGINLKTDSVVTNFLNAQNVKTRKTYACNFKKVIEFTHQSGAEILADSNAWKQKIKAFNQWLIDQGYSKTTIQSQTGMVRGFFRHYEKKLELDSKVTRQLNRKARNSTDYLFSLNDIKRMSNIGSLREKYVLLCGISFGLRAEDFAALTFGQYRRALERSIEPPIPMDATNTEKEDVQAHPFISSDALPLIKALLESNKNAKDSDIVFNENPAQLTRILKVLAYKTGIDTHDARIRFHNCRKFLFDNLSCVMSEDKAKGIIGKTLSEGAYLNSETLRECYASAMPRITVSSNGEIRHKVDAQNEEIEKLKSALYDTQQGQLKLDAIIDMLINESKDEHFKEKARMLKSVVDQNK